MLSPDVAIIGSGFAGSLMSLLLTRLGRTCVVVDRQSHPRFAIGESSTPLADMALRDIAKKYNLQRLAPLTKYGTWMAAYPQVMRGLKRGFSYFDHEPHQPFVPRPDHANELLVAASTDDATSDTHWLRSEVDAFFAAEAVAAGVPLFENTSLTHIERNTTGWELSGSRGPDGRDGKVNIKARFIIDASGEGKVLGRTLGIEDEKHLLKTNSRPLFAHFKNLKPWREMLVERAADVQDHPFDCDRAALHQVFRGAWMWQLRFDSEVVSAGFAIDAGKHPLDDTMTPKQEWKEWMEQYPTLCEQFAQAEIVNPPRGLTRGPRMQRLMAQGAGPDWAMLPHTAGFIDPLHSSGIAHSLFGIERLAAIFEAHWAKASLAAELQEYARIVRTEVQLVDILVAGCYAGTVDFRFFSAMCMFYFAGTIACERARCDSEFDPARYFLNANDAAFRQAAATGYSRLQELLVSNPTDHDINAFTEFVRDTIAPWNTANLMNPTARNMYRHTAARK
ncbi:MAG: NAD(P)/FAD-dependent oxidoreductase [Pirellulaceae bacterium]